MTDEAMHNRKRAADRSEGAPREAPRVIESASLFGDEREVGIRHRGEVYRLRVTRNGKLILNK
jgi:hemin uptake protein HemP